MRFQKTDAIVLKKNNFSDYHKIVTLFTRDYGKVQAIAKGVRRMKSKMAPHLECGTHVTCMLIEGKGLHTLSSVKAKSNQKKIRANLSKTAELYLMCETVDKFTDEGQQDYALHDMLQESLLLLENGVGKSEDTLVSSAFLVKLLKISGYMPELHTCVISGEKIDEEENFLSIEKGGLVKPVHKLTEHMKLSAIQIKIMRYIERETLQNIKNVKLDFTELEGIQRTLNVYAHYLLSKPIKSQQLIEKIKNVH